jgi:hypothetical protein
MNPPLFKCVKHATKEEMSPPHEKKQPPSIRLAEPYGNHPASPHLTRSCAELSYGVPLFECLTLVIRANPAFAIDDLEV